MVLQVSNRGVDFDEIFVTITRLNAKSVTSHTQTKEIIHNTNVKVKVDRVLSPNPQVSVANLKVSFSSLSLIHTHSLYESLISSYLIFNVFLALGGS